MAKSAKRIWPIIVDDVFDMFKRSEQKELDEIIADQEKVNAEREVTGKKKDSEDKEKESTSRIEELQALGRRIAEAAGSGGKVDKEMQALQQQDRQENLMGEMVKNLTDVAGKMSDWLGVGKESNSHLKDHCRKTAGSVLKLMGTYSAITCTEEDNTAVEDWVDGKMTASVVLRCDWADRYNLVTDLLFTPRAWPKSPYAFAPGCVSARILNDGPSNVVSQSLVYEQARVEAKYDFQTQDLYTENLESMVEFQTLDHKLFRWGSSDGDALLEKEAPGRPLERLALVRSLRRVPDPMPPIVFDGGGKVNHVSHTSVTLNRTFAAETLLYIPPQTSRTISTSGTEGWDLTMRFMYKPEGWNQYWRAKTNDYDEIHLIEAPPGAGGDTTYRNYPLADFSALLF